MKELKVIDLADCAVNTKPTPKVRLPWYLRVQGKLERWYVSKIKGINPHNQRIIRFYTYNDEQGVEFDFKSAEKSETLFRICMVFLAITTMM